MEVTNSLETEYLEAITNLDNVTTKARGTIARVEDSCVELTYENHKSQGRLLAALDNINHQCSENRKPHNE